MSDILRTTSGKLNGAIHQLPLRIFYQDTDVSGFVYHANYLNYMERGRTEFLRLLGITQRQSLEAPEVDRCFFAVRHLEIDYLRPAHLDDELIVESALQQLAAASALIDQRIWRGDDLLVRAEIRVAFIGHTGKPRRLPVLWREILQNLPLAAFDDKTIRQD